MEEDVEIEHLYKTHGQMLMEAAAAAETDSEEENKNSIDDLGVQSFQNNKSADQKLKSKRNKRQTNRKSKRIKMKKITDDFEDLMNDELVNCLARQSESYAMEKVDEGEEEEKNCINEILSGNPIVLERRSGVKESHPGDINNELLSNELNSLLRNIEKRSYYFEEWETKIVNKIIENDNKQKEIRERLKSQLGNKGLNEPSFTKTYYKKFGSPYFHDKDGFSPVPNEDTLSKKNMGIPSKKTFKRIRQWTNTDKDILQDAIHATLKNENCERLVQKIEKLKGSLVRVIDELTDMEIRDSIEKLQNQLRKTKCMSYVSLLANESLDREYDWLKYSAKDFSGAHSADECRRFWHLYLKPTINKSSWSESEDNQLTELVEGNEHKDWDSIARSLATNRSGYQTFIHYKNRICNQKEFLTGKWTEEEDKKLLRIVNSAKFGGHIPWSKVASYMGGRTHNQIYNRYHNCLDPKLVKGKFTPEEDLLLVAGIEVFRANYQELSMLMSHRTANQIRERYERHLLPKSIKVGTFSLEEDELLLKLIDKYGAKNFSLIAKTMKTRTRTQVRQRYNAIMHIKKTKPDWTPASVKRRSLNQISKCMLRTHQRVNKLKNEIEKFEKTLGLDDLDNELVKMEKLKELRDTLFMKKYELKPSKKKVITPNSEVNTQLIEFFKNHNENNQTKSIKIQSSVDSAAYFNEMLVLAKYFGHDLKLPESPDEILNNKMLSLNLRSFLVQNLKQQTKIDKKAENLSFPLETDPINIDYVKPLVDDSLIMEDKWHSTTTNISNLNFSEIFKRTVFDYSNGVHRDIWESKMERSKMPEFTTQQPVPNNQKSPNNQKFFIPPNSVTTLGMKSVMLSRQRLRRDIRKKPGTFVLSGNPLTFGLQDKFIETLLSLFYCPKMLSFIDSSEILKFGSKTENFQCSGFSGKIADPRGSEEKLIDSIIKETRPIKNDALYLEKLKRQILEQNRQRIENLREAEKNVKCSKGTEIHNLIKRIKQGLSKAKQNINERETRNNAELKSNSSTSKCLEAETSSEKPCEQIKTVGVKSKDCRKACKKQVKDVEGVDTSCDNLIVNTKNLLTYKRNRESSQNNPIPKKSLTSHLKDVNGLKSGITNILTEPSLSCSTRSTIKD